MDVPEKSPGLDSLPPDFPYPWCSDYGEDEYGIFMAFTYEGVRQGFRWIPPGAFWMGSPESEEGRYDGVDRKRQENRYKVILTKGYWMAETTCTQALWEAVTRKNPSRFIGKNRPVERVSWQDVQRFIETLNYWKRELALRLPSEAEWEYACRSGTETAFWFGNQIDQEKVHFGKDNNSGTLQAMALEPNYWGLYQMHGNVEEWCENWMKAYPTYYPFNAVRDPKEDGVGVGFSRVLRGGSWFNLGRYCRSAYRNCYSPHFANIDIGFRLVRGT